MAELEPIRDIAKRLLREYRDKRDRRAFEQLLDRLPAPQNQADGCANPDCSAAPLPMSDNDRAFLRSLRIRP